MSHPGKKARTKPSIGRTHFNQPWSSELLKLDPHEIRETIETSLSVKTSGLEFFLTQSEEQARDYLKVHLPRRMTSDLKLSDLYWAAQEPATFSLDPRQEAAVAVLMRAFSIRNLFIEFDAQREEGRPQWAPAMSVIRARSLAEKIAVEMLQFVLAAVRGDFIDLKEIEHVMQTEDVKRRHWAHKASETGVESKKRISYKKGLRCYDTLKIFFKKAGNPYRVISLNWKHDWPNLSEKDRSEIGDTPPSKKQIQRYFRDKNLPFLNDSTLSYLSKKKRRSHSKGFSEVTR